MLFNIPAIVNLCEKKGRKEKREGIKTGRKEGGREGSN